MSRRASSDSGGLFFKTGIFALIAALGWFIFRGGGGKQTEPVGTAKPDIELPSTPESAAPKESTVPEALFPVGGKGQLVRHRYFALSYLEAHEQAEWVAYELSRSRLNENWAERLNNFRPDQAVDTESATPRDYNGSGYDKGHLCPAADMAFSEEAIDETFLMSNMSPQLRGFNGGVWRELEELTRDWARRFKRLEIVTGPVLTRTPLGQIGFSKVTVPAYYYKVLFAPEVHKAIAFIMPNSVSEAPVMSYAVTIDAVEEQTGLNFFPKSLGGLNEELEASLDKAAWPINQNRYEKRIREWNRR